MRNREEQQALPTYVTHVYMFCFLKTVYKINRQLWEFERVWLSMYCTLDRALPVGLMRVSTKQRSRLELQLMCAYFGVWLVRGEKVPGLNSVNV